MAFRVEIPMDGGAEVIEFEPGSSVIFVGANGSGKTRLAVRIEKQLELKAHRLAAHRALVLNPSVPKVSEREARAGLQTGNASEDSLPGHRPGNRWRSKEAVHLLNDFDFLIQALFAEQANTALETHNAASKSRTLESVRRTRFQTLKDIWDQVLPQRELLITGDDIRVNARGEKPYSAASMSDGERSIFYMIGQTLMVSGGAALIVDEPELHVHPSITAKLWDLLEAARPDCAFLFITHDLTFAATRLAQKFVLRDYDGERDQWVVERVPEDTGFSEEDTSLILGSRRPVLFVEGGESSIDVALYRACFPDWTVLPRGSCEEVIHSVVTMRANASLTRVTCGGVVDADNFSERDVAYLAELGVGVLPVAEVENLFLLPAVSRAIAGTDGYVGDELDARLKALEGAVLGTLVPAANVEAAVARHCRRMIDRQLKRVDLSGWDSVDEIATEYARRTAELDVKAIGAAARERIRKAIEMRDLPLLLANYDNKGLLKEAAQHLRANKKRGFEEWLVRVLKNGTHPELVAVLKAALPAVEPR